MLTLVEKTKKMKVVKELLKEIGVEWQDFCDYLFFKKVEESSRKSLDEMDQKCIRIKQEIASMRQEYGELKAFDAIKKQELKSCPYEHLKGPSLANTVYVDVKTGIWACCYCLKSGPYLDGICIKSDFSKKDKLVVAIDNVREELYRYIEGKNNDCICRSTNTFE